MPMSLVRAIMFLVVLSVVVSVALATDPQPCCGPNKYMGKIMLVSGSAPNDMMVGGSSSGKYETMEISYDYDMKRMAVDVNSLDLNSGNSTQTRVVYEYKMNKMFIIPKQGGCFANHLDANSMAPPCVNASYTYGGSFRVGGAKSSAMLNNFYGQMGSNGVGSEWVTADDCTIVSLTYYGSSEDGKMGISDGMVFADMKRDIVDATMFILPAACSTASSIPIGIGRRSLEATLEKFRMPY